MPSFLLCYAALGAVGSTSRFATRSASRGRGVMGWDGVGRGTSCDLILIDPSTRPHASRNFKVEYISSVCCCQILASRDHASRDHADMQ